MTSRITAPPGQTGRAGQPEKTTATSTRPAQRGGFEIFGDGDAHETTPAGDNMEGSMPTKSGNPAASGKANGAGIEKQNRNHDAVGAADAQARKARGKDFTRQQIGWTRQVRLDPKMPDKAVRIADALAFDYMNETTGDAWPAMKTLCARVGASERRVRVVLDLMVERGHLTIKSGGGRMQSNRYSWIIRDENPGKYAIVSDAETPAFTAEYSDGRCCKSQHVGDLPLSPAVSGNAFNLGSAECVEAVHKRDTDVDFGCLTIGIP